MFDSSSIRLMKIYFGSIAVVSLACALLAGHEGGIAFVIVFLGQTFYFMPTLIAGLRKSNAFTSIFALNFLAGWSIVGWVASLIWSLYKPAVANAVVDNNSIASELEHLAQLKEKGILTKEEFDSRKSVILASQPI